MSKPNRQRKQQLEVVKQCNTALSFNLGLCFPYMFYFHIGFSWDGTGDYSSFQQLLNVVSLCRVCRVILLSGIVPDRRGFSSDCLKHQLWCCTILNFTLTKFRPLSAFPAADGLQCYGCNIIHGQRYVDVGCSNPEVITCAHSHKGFKHRFCIKTESSE